MKTVKNRVEANAQLPWWKQFLRHDEIEKVVKSCTDDLDRSLLVSIARRDLAPEVRADRALVRSSADANQNTASSPIISTVKEQEDIPNPSPARNPDLLNPGVQHGLQLVSRALKSELDRRDACKETQAAADAQSLGDDQPNTRSGRPIASEEQQRLSELEEVMQRLFLPGDSEDPEGIFHDSGEGGDPIAGQNDPAQSALDLLDKLRNPIDSSYSEQTLKRLRKLSDNLDELGLLDENVMVLQILTAFCRRKVIANGNALDWVNLASTLRHLSRSFLMVGRSDEALATSEEAISIIKPMADREPRRYTIHLVRAMGLKSVLHHPPLLASPAVSTSVVTPSQSQPTLLITWDGADALNVSSDVLGLFVTISSPITPVRHILIPVLLGIKDIYISVKEVEETREGAEDLAKKVLRMMVRTVDAMHAANVVPSAHSAFTLTMIELHLSLSEIFEKIRRHQHAQGEWWSSASQRKEIKDILDAGRATFRDARSQAQFEFFNGLYGTSSSYSAAVPALASSLRSPEPAQQQHRALLQQPQPYLSTGQPLQQDNQSSTPPQKTNQTSTSASPRAPSQPQQSKSPRCLRRHHATAPGVPRRGSGTFMKSGCAFSGSGSYGASAKLSGN
ncbi:unnamed protein product [Tilletia laevis]|uniref:Uncharacterized protein n=4 Tax=Tilletia TaxID=13289 RepID=A0A8X7SX66_9BASI|nr:hypothetical protein CF336_g4004 [Tilletia laevis]KAE8247361.1 hypothetical protein A4X06_0g4515 [Tilletia controversa]KAE8261583.1 hypothetical protein A4X03_0g3130 [Tilletia caries]KAE8207586.1 hypothetical protein CF335_g1033 [Tilletia laevis]CAD6888003.1 unnamed protein product [Tilletia caries]